MKIFSNLKENGKADMLFLYLQIFLALFKNTIYASMQSG